MNLKVGWQVGQQAAKPRSRGDEPFLVGGVHDPRLKTPLTRG